jgi:hypothetical protein
MFELRFEETSIARIVIVRFGDWEIRSSRALDNSIAQLTITDGFRSNRDEVHPDKLSNATYHEVSKRLPERLRDHTATMVKDFLDQGI